MTFIKKHKPTSYQNLKDIMTVKHFNELKDKCDDVSREISLNIIFETNDFSFPIIVYEYHNKYSVYIKGLVPDSYLIYF
jgi:hypothetical protein